ncbi:MAG: Holliday junction branch migration protein RuvA [Actinobacteria bacterium]|nr:Holliday junction branch migration protein RuvA [Actinomycetota bacterium]
MIERVRGTVVALHVDGAVLDVGGVGFRLEMSRTTLRDLPQMGEPAVALTYLHVRDEALQLFGFSSEEERELFLRLISVSKIGPKLALAALSVRRPREVRRAIAAGDVAFFQSVPGIGKKTAERLILELRETMAAIEGSITGPLADEEDGSEVHLAKAALAELGMTAAEAEHLLRDADPDTSANELVRVALRKRR